MAAPDNSPHLKRVLHSYKTQAMNSLQGPGAQHHLMESTKGLVEDPGVSSFYYSAHKVKMYYEECAKRRASAEPCKKCDMSSEGHLALPMPLPHPPATKCSPPPPSDNSWTSSSSLPPHLLRGPCHREPPAPSTNTCRSSAPILLHQQQPDDLEKEKGLSKRDDPAIVIVKNDVKMSELVSEKGVVETQQLQQEQQQQHPPPFSLEARRNPRHILKTEDTADTNPPSCDSANFKWVEPQIFLAPAPFPPQPLPVLTSADPGVVPSQHRRSETYLDGNPIACFTTGGEPRLCLPQILNSVLINFSLTEINARCDELQIFCSRCTSRQLEYLKDSGVLPPTATSCGLITKTDAQRLTHALLYAHISRPPPKKLLHAHDKHQEIRISHNCFGKCKGAIWPEVYNSPADPCIVCLECNNIYTTMQFVCHAHKAIENKTCHWGFDVDNWRDYVMLSKDQVLQLHKAEIELQAFKNKFDLSYSGNHKRKQGTSDTTDELVKKVRGDDMAVGAYNVGAYNALSNYMAYGGYARKPPAWTVVPLVTKDGKSLPLPPAVFAKESMPTSIPSYLLSQGPPVLVDPGRVVPMSQTENFERNFQPNVALAPPKVRDKMAREALELERIKSEQYGAMSGTITNGVTPVVYQKYLDMSNKASKCEKSPSRCENGKEDSENKIIYVKMESSPPPTSSPSQPPTRSPLPHQDALKQHHVTHLKQENQRPLPRLTSMGVASSGVSSGATTSGDLSEEQPPDLVLSTTDSDTESVSSVASKSEVVEEAEALMRGWTDRAAAKKVLDIVASLAKASSDKDRHMADMRKHRNRLHNRLTAKINQENQHQQHRQQHKPKEENLLEKMSMMEKELRELRDKNGLCFKVKQEP